MVAKSDLTPLQFAVYELRTQDLHNPLSYAKIAKKLGLTERRIQILHESAVKKKGGVDPAAPANRPPSRIARPLGTETTDPEDAAKAMIDLSLPSHIQPRFEEICLESGLGRAAVEALSKLLKEQYRPVKEQIQEVKLKEFATLMRQKAWMVATSIDEQTIQDAGLKDRAVALGILTDKSLLIEGKPTVITDHTRPKKIEELLKVVGEAMERRGIKISESATIDVPAEVVQ
jgi:hypothetical protein